jgi:hypothetical protein
MGCEAVVGCSELLCLVGGCVFTVLQPIVIIIIIVARGTLVGGINLAGLTSDMFFYYFNCQIDGFTSPPLAFPFFLLFLKESTIT